MDARLENVAGALAIRATVCAGTVETHYLRAGHGPPVVLLQGRGSAAGSGSSLLASLAARFRVILPQEVRLREPAAAGAERNGARASTWLRDFLDGLGLQRVSLVASGEGETLALEFDREQPERVERLVLLGPLTPGAASPEELGERVIRSLDAAEARVAPAPGAPALPVDMHVHAGVPSGA